MRAYEFLNEEQIGVTPKRPRRDGSRPSRGHQVEPQYTTTADEVELSERGKASRQLCLSKKPDSQLGASNLSSCKSQGLRARDGKKTHLIGDTRISVGGKKMKGKKYGGELPDYS